MHPNNKKFSFNDIKKTVSSYKKRADFFKDHPDMYNFLNNTRQLDVIKDLTRKKKNSHLSKKISKKIKEHYTKSNYHPNYKK